MAVRVNLLVTIVWCLCLGELCLGNLWLSHLCADDPSYVRQVQPILRKYCGGCHNESDREGDFSVASHQAILKGTPKGSVIDLSSPGESQLLKLITGRLEPKMPPEDEAQLKPEEVELLARWLAAGAKSDADQVPLDEQIMAPKLEADAAAREYISCMIALGNGQAAVARTGQVEIRDCVTQQVLYRITDLPGRPNQLRLSPDGTYLLIAGGIAGVGGHVTIVQLRDRSVIARLQGHSDTIYCAAMSPDNRLVCTGSYDRVAILWDWQAGKELRRFVGHNGAIYDVDIDPSGMMLATASADQTVKLWGMADGARLDTLGQPEGEMQCVRFTPDGWSLLASGADRQIRLWQILAKDRPAINPMREARFAHQQAVTQLILLGSEQLISLSEDKTIKLWQLPDLIPLGIVTKSRDLPVGAARVNDAQQRLLVADFTGSIAAVSLPKPTVKATTMTQSQATMTQPQAVATVAASAPATTAQVPADALSELEPNDRPEQAQRLDIPAKVKGTIAGEATGQGDMDCFAIEALAGQPWIIEIQAARDKSPLDSLIEVLDADGQAVLRTRLQAVRQTYFTFRGKDSSTSDDFRMHKWQEMELNELLYAGGEVVKLWLYPRGPDSGFKVYPGTGSRITYFDTTPTAHALGEVAYIVRELQDQVQPLPNGLPVFPIYYQNDDDAQRRNGKDSRLTFTAPRDGHYIIRVRDARGFGGEDFKYQLTVRPQQPDFELQLQATDIKLAPGSGREWPVVVRRIDGLEAPIEIHVADVPAGLEVTNPLIIQAGQESAIGNIYALPDFKLPQSDQSGAANKLTLSLRAVSRQSGREVTHELKQKLTVSLIDEAVVGIRLVDAQDSQRELDELVIRPGQTVTARVVIDRRGNSGPVGFGKEDAGRNLPHGTYVDNIGLNGLLITEANSEREFFITAANWLEPQERLFHLRSDTKHNPTSRSVRLRVLAK